MLTIIKKVNEYFIYSETGENATATSYTGGNKNNNALKISPDAISYVTSGLLDADRKKVISYLA